MSRTDLDATTLANSLRMMAGDGSMEWVYEPIRASVLLDIADMLDENAKLREFASEAFSMAFNFYHGAGTAEDLRELEAEYHELGIEVD